MWYHPRSTRRVVASPTRTTHESNSLHFSHSSDRAARGMRDGARVGHRERAHDHDRPRRDARERATGGDRHHRRVAGARAAALDDRHRVGDARGVRRGVPRLSLARRFVPQSRARAARLRARDAAGNPAGDAARRDVPRRGESGGAIYSGARTPNWQRYDSPLSSDTVTASSRSSECSDRPVRSRTPRPFSGSSNRWSSASAIG